MRKKKDDLDPLAFIRDGSKESDASGMDFEEKNSLSISVEESSVGIGTIIFDGEMSIYNSKKIKNVLCSGVNDYSQFNIELSRVKKIDCSGFQLLLSALKEIRYKKKVMKFIRPSKEIKKIFNLFGEEQLLKEMIK